MGNGLHIFLRLSNILYLWIRLGSRENFLIDFCLFNFFKKSDQTIILKKMDDLTEGWDPI